MDQEVFVPATPARFAAHSHAVVRKPFAGLARSGVAASEEANCTTALGVPSGRSFIALLEAFRSTGGTAPAHVVGRLLGEHGLGDSASLAAHIRAGRAFGWDWRDHLWIPMFQFGADDLVLKSGVHRVCAELPAPWSGWLLAAWFATGNPLLDGRSPAELLDSDPGAVSEAARSLACAHAWALQRAPRACEVETVA